MLSFPLRHRQRLYLKGRAQQCCRLAFKGDTVELFHFVGAFAGVDRETFLGIAPGVGRRQLDYSGGIGMAGSDEKCSSEENYNPSLRTNFKVCSSFSSGARLYLLSSLFGATSHNGESTMIGRRQT